MQIRILFQSFYVTVFTSEESNYENIMAVAPCKETRMRSDNVLGNSP